MNESGKTSAEAGAPLPVTDAQTHIWAEHTSQRPWPANSATRAHRQGAFGAEDLLAEMDAAGVDRAILVPPSFEGDRNDVVCAAAREHPARFAVMARLPLAASDVRDRFEEVIADENVRGLRLTFHLGDSATWLQDGTADWVWPAIERADLAVMLYAPGRFDEFARLCEAQPGTRFILDSLGLWATMRDGEIDPYLDALVKLARFPNLGVKAVALPEYVIDAYPYRSLAPRVRRLLDAFGAQRIFWASDLTRAKCSYEENVHYLRDLDVMSLDELGWVMGRGINMWLKWPT